MNRFALSKLTYLIPDNRTCEVVALAEDSFQIKVFEKDGSPVLTLTDNMGKCVEHLYDISQTTMPRAFTASIKQTLRTHLMGLEVSALT